MCCACPESRLEFAETLQDMAPFPILAFSREAESVFDTFPPAIRRVGSQDCRLAAQAMAHNLVVVTRNLRDFEAIGAPCEDWSL